MTDTLRAHYGARKEDSMRPDGANEALETWMARMGWKLSRGPPDTCWPKAVAGFAPASIVSMTGWIIPAWMREGERMLLSAHGGPALTTHANSTFSRPAAIRCAPHCAWTHSPVANAKIISIVDHEVAAALRLTAKDLAAARAQATNDLRFVTDNLRHDINTLAAALNQLRADVDQLKQACRKQMRSLPAEAKAR